MKRLPLVLSLMVFLWVAGCAPQTTQTPDQPHILVIESFLADITAQVAGDRVIVESLIPAGLDPHAFEPTPQDAARIAEAGLIVINGAGLESWLGGVLENSGGQAVVIEASAGLAPRQADGEDHLEGDPHFWLDPLNVIHYVENIRDGLGVYDPASAEVYAANADAYIVKLRELDGWIAQQIEIIPPERRLLVTNHESFGYYAERYGLKIVGAIIPGASSIASPSAQQLAALVEQVKTSGAPAIFLETGSNPQMAEQLALETGAQVITGLMSHSLSASGEAAATYIDMMRYNTEMIVAALR